MQRFALYGTVVVAGAAVLAVEILGTRVLGPFYGVSLFLWSALITVTLVALSAGYWLGGRWADRGPAIGRLGLLLAAAGAWLLLLPWLRRPILLAIEPLGLRAALLTAALVLFAPPLVLLGMVSPYALRLRVQEVREVGRTAGRLSAISTLAGVAAALATGFWLIPSVGVTRLTQLTGSLLLAMAAVDWAAARRRLAAPTTPLVLAAALASLLAASGRVPRPAFVESASGDGRLVARQESPYADVRVIDRGSDRYLILDGSIHTLIDARTGEPMLGYVPVVGSARLLFDSPGKLLLLGLGGGSVAKDYAAAGWDVDAVEIDPVVADFARRHFSLAESDARVFVMDAREFLLQARDRYRLIVFDAFGSGAIPFHLATRECFRLAASRLAGDGVLALNLEAVGWDDPIVAAFARTLRDAVSDVAALPTAEPPNAFGNVVLLASNRRLESPEDRLERPFLHLADASRHWEIVQQNHAWQNLYRPSGRATAMSDDRNAVELLSEKVNREARRRLHEASLPQVLAW